MAGRSFVPRSPRGYDRYATYRQSPQRKYPRQQGRNWIAGPQGPVVEEVTIQGAVAGGNSPVARIAAAPGGARAGAPPDFPGTSVLDDFNRANESPVATNWSSIIWTGGGDFAGLELASNALTTRFVGDNASSWYDVQEFDRDQEAYCDVVAGMGGDNEIRIALRIQNPGAVGLTCYEGRFSHFSDEFVIYRWDDNSTAVFLGSVSGTLADGDKFGVRAVGNEISVWKQSGGVWSKELVVTDSTYTTGGFVGLRLGGGFATLPIADNFAGGAVSAAPRAVVAVTPGGATGAGNAPATSTTVSAQGATGQGTSPVPTVPVTPGGATGQGNNANATATAVPTPGGGTGQGNSPAPTAAATPGGGTGFGTSPNPSAEVPQGGAAAPGTGPLAVVTLSPGGATAGGNAPTETTAITETPEFGGAIAGGNSPTAVVSATAQGSIGGGAGPAAASVANQGGSTADDFDVSPIVGVTPGGATSGGNAPQAPITEQVTPGGAIAGGAGPAASSVANQGGSSADDFDVSAVVGVTPGGATSGGNQPQAPLSETPTFGGAIAGGAGPAAASVANQGGSTAADFDVSPTITITAGGATSGGNAPSSPMIETPIFGGAIAGGSGPAAASVANQGGSTASDFDISAVIGVTPGGATSGGNAPFAPITEIVTPGGAIASGNAPGSSTTVTPGGVITGDFDIFPTITVTAGGATSGGFPPFEEGLIVPGIAVGGDRAAFRVSGGDRIRFSARGGDRQRDYATGGDRRS